MFFDIFFQLHFRQGHPLTVLPFFNCVSYLNQDVPSLFSSPEPSKSAESLCLSPFRLRWLLPLCSAQWGRGTNSGGCIQTLVQLGNATQWVLWRSSWFISLASTAFSHSAFNKELCGIAWMRLLPLHDDGRTRVKVMALWHTANSSSTQSKLQSYEVLYECFAVQVLSAKVLQSHPLTQVSHTSCQVGAPPFVRKGVI